MDCRSEEGKVKGWALVPLRLVADRGYAPPSALLVLPPLTFHKGSTDSLLLVTGSMAVFKGCDPHNETNSPKGVRRCQGCSPWLGYLYTMLHPA